MMEAAFLLFRRKEFRLSKPDVVYAAMPRLDEEGAQRSAKALESVTARDTISAAGESIEFINSAVLLHRGHW